MRRGPCQSGGRCYFIPQRASLASFTTLEDALGGEDSLDLTTAQILYDELVTLQTLEEKVKTNVQTEMELLENTESSHPTGNKRLNKKTKPQESFFKYYNM